MQPQPITRPIIEHTREMEHFNGWLNDQAASTLILSIHGIGGIGKTTLLTEMAGTAQRASLLTLWLDGQSELSSSSAFLSALELGLASEYNRLRAEEDSQLAYIVSELSRQKTVLLIDHCESLAAVQGWLLATFLPQLASANVLFVFASRGGLPTKWLTNPYWSPRIVSCPLRLFNRAEVNRYVQGCGLSPDIQQRIARQTEGHPLLLALTVDLLQEQAGHSQRTLNLNIPAILSADFLQEAASPELYQALTMLSLLPAADQGSLTYMLEQPVLLSAYHALAQLSFVRTTAHGLALHHVVAHLLREDWAQRHPLQFQTLRQRALEWLIDEFHGADKRWQMRIAAHVLELYREFLPTAHAYADFSTRLLSGEQQPYRPEDLPVLQQLLSESIQGSNWQSELVQPDAYYALLDDIASHCPTGIFIVRDEAGAPLAFCAGLWLHQQTLPLLQQYVPALLPVLDNELPELRETPPEAADSVFILLAAVDVQQPLYAPEELGALLLQHWLISMTLGVRGMMVTGDPQLNALFPILGLHSQGTLPACSADHGELTRWEIDFRQIAFPEWIQTIIRQTGLPRASALPSKPEARAAAGTAETTPTGSAASEVQAAANAAPSSASGSASSAAATPSPYGDGGAPPAPGISRLEMKRVLELLYRPEQLHALPVVRALQLRGIHIHARINEALHATPATSPLTELQQRILRETYLNKQRNKNQLADAFHMSRTTFYRQSQLALTHLAYLVSSDSFSENKHQEQSS